VPPRSRCRGRTCIAPRVGWSSMRSGHGAPGGTTASSRSLSMPCVRLDQQARGGDVNTVIIKPTGLIRVYGFRRALLWTSTLKNGVEPLCPYMASTVVLFDVLDHAMGCVVAETVRVNPSRRCVLVLPLTSATPTRSRRDSPQAFFGPRAL